MSTKQFKLRIQERILEFDQMTCKNWHEAAQLLSDSYKDYLSISPDFQLPHQEIFFRKSRSALQSLIEHQVADLRDNPRTVLCKKRYIIIRKTLEGMLQHF